MMLSSLDSSLRQGLFLLKKNKNSLISLQKQNLANKIRAKGQIHEFGKKVYTWGQLQSSSLGFGDKDKDSSLPLLFPTISNSGYRDISVGANHTGIVTGDGELYVFGKSNYGQCGLERSASTGMEKLLELIGIGNKSGPIVNVPLKIELSNVIKVSCGNWHTCAITEDGKVYSWGWGHALGHKNTKENQSTPKLIESLKDEIIVDVSCGERHTLLLTKEGRPFACGDGQHGRLGTGSIRSCRTPVFLEYFNQIKVEKVFAGKEFSFVLSKDGVPFGFGRNDRIQLGTGGNLAADIYSCDPTPGEVNIDRIVDMSLSSGDVLCVDIDGNVFNWGDRVYLEPTKINEERFQDEKPSGKIIQTAVGNSFMMFLTDKGELFTCNKKTGIQSDIYALGHGATNPFRVAKRVQALRSEFVLKVSASDTRVAVIVK